MNTNKDIFEQIKDKSQELKLDVKSDLWDRMEEKLEKQPINIKRNNASFLRIAASLVLLVGIISFTSLLLSQNEYTITANNIFQIEELRDDSSAYEKFKNQEFDRMVYRQKLEQLYGGNERRSSFK